MKGVPLYVEPIHSCTKEPRVVEDFTARHVVEERVSALLSQVVSCGLESGPDSLETCSIQVSAMIFLCRLLWTPDGMANVVCGTSFLCNDVNTAW